MVAQATNSLTPKHYGRRINAPPTVLRVEFFPGFSDPARLHVEVWQDSRRFLGYTGTRWQARAVRRRLCARRLRFPDRAAEVERNLPRPHGRNLPVGYAVSARQRCT